jgi:hypothetical protein
LARAGAAALVLLALAAGAIGCGGGEGAAAGATVTVYVSTPMRGPEAAAGHRLCNRSRRQLDRREGMAGDLKVRLVCLDAGGPDGRWTLARVGANARLASEDSTTVAYIGEPDRGARRQSRPIVEAGGIAEVNGDRTSMRQILEAIEAGDTSQPRQAVFDAFAGS